METYSKEFWESWVYKKEPLLVLGVFSREISLEAFKEPSEWQLVRHQTAGMLCHSIELFAKILPVKKELMGSLYRLEKKYLGTMMAQGVDDMAWSTSLTELNEYNRFLKEELGVTCEHQYKVLEEGFYPLDPTPGNIKQLTGIEIVDLTETFLKEPIETGTLKDLTTWGRYAHTKWVLAILGENSD